MRKIDKLNYSINHELIYYRIFASILRSAEYLAYHAKELYRGSDSIFSYQFHLVKYYDENGCDDHHVWDEENGVLKYIDGTEVE